MIVSELKLYNFRKFKSVKGAPGLHIKFHEGLNALIGENDSGKTAVIDALKLVLLTESNEYVRPTDEDFYTEDGVHFAAELKIELTLSSFSDNEAKNFVEYLEFSLTEGKKPEYIMHLHYRARRENGRIYSELRVGDVDDGITLEGKAKDLLRAVYLRPLRDAEREMSSGRNSRISQILFNHPVVKSVSEQRLQEIVTNANEEIEKHFAEDDYGKTVLRHIRKTLQEFNEQGRSNDAKLKTSDVQLKSILESLSLKAPEYHPGLGELNLLFMAAELLLLQNDESGGIRLALIEELEAHLHPQAQLRLIQYLQHEYQEKGVQIIISTHSPVLASKINLKNLVLLKNGMGFDLSPDNTKLEKGDYLFLQRFLDSTKANLFFAKGVIMVEGSAEEMVVPMIADIIGCPLEKNGVSIVNVGGTSFLRYSRIFQRADNSLMGIPVAVITDCDVKPENEQGCFCEKNEEMAEAVSRKKQKYSGGDVRGFIAPKWTLEYCIALSCLSEEFHKSIYYGNKIKNSDVYALTKDKIIDANKSYETDYNCWKSLHSEEYAYNVYKLMLTDGNSSNLKAIVAQCFTAFLLWNISDHTDKINQEEMFNQDLYRMKINSDKKEELKRRIEKDVNLRYLVDAIKYATNCQ